MLKMYILKLEYPIKQELFDFLLEFTDSERRSDLSCRRNRQNAQTSLAGELMTKLAIKKQFGIPFKNQHFLRSEHGKPYLEGYPHIHFNISHSGNFVVCAVSDKPVGIDIQKIGEYKERVAKRICTENELSSLKSDGEKFTCLWTQKEAVLKLKGTGFTDGDIKGCLLDANTETQKIENYYISTAI